MPISASSSPRKRSTLSVDLGGLRAPLLAFCQTAAVRPSEAIRRLVTNALRAAIAPTVALRPLAIGSEPALQGGALPGVTARERVGHYESEVRKLTVRLGSSEYGLVAELARVEGFTISRWIAGLVRSRLVGGAVLNRSEMQVLADSNSQLGAIGRNLNQLLRVLNRQASDVTAFDAAQIAQLRDEIRVHREAVSALILSSSERWQVGRGGVPGPVES